MTIIGTIFTILAVANTKPAPLPLQAMHYEPYILEPEMPETDIQEPEIIEQEPLLSVPVIPESDIFKPENIESIPLLSETEIPVPQISYLETESTELETMKPEILDYGNVKQVPVFPGLDRELEVLTFEPEILKSESENPETEPAFEEVTEDRAETILQESKFL